MFDVTLGGNTYVNCNLIRHTTGRCPQYLIVNKDGPVAFVNIPSLEGEHKCMAGTILVKDYAENTGMLNFLKEHALVQGEPIEWVRSGFIEAPVYKFDSQAALDL